MNYEILKDIVIILALSTLVNFIFTKIKIPTLVGYLLTGILAGPSMLGIIGSQYEIEVMAEVGVVILLFTIGLEFSLKHLVKIRKIVFFGGFIQVSLTVLLTLSLASSAQIDWKGALFTGFLIALSSTAVVLKVLQDRSEVTSNYGRTVVGILIFQDILLIPLLLFTPFLKGDQDNFGTELYSMTIKAVFIIAFVVAGNKWLMPRLLHWIALTRNQELFLMSIFLICLSVALFTSQLGITLAFGAFLAGLMISESEYSTNAFGNLIPFRDTFTSFFFVSIGMLLDLEFVYRNFGIVLLAVLLVVFIKMIIGGLTAFLMGHTFRGTIMVGFALCQVGEFSFILSKLGVSYQIISNYHYQLFLAVAIITMSISPLLIQAGNPLAGLLLKLPIPDLLKNGLFPLPQIEIPDLSNHLVIIGKDSRAINLAMMAKCNKIPYISIIFDPAIVRKRQEKGDSVIYGDALNEPILNKAQIDRARIVVVSVGDLIPAFGIVNMVRHLNKHAMILVRTKQVDDIDEFYRLGANQVIPEEFETAVDIFERILSTFLMPRDEIETTIARIRDGHWGISEDIMLGEKPINRKNFADFEIVALKVSKHSILTGKTISELKAITQCGAKIVALNRNGQLINHLEAESRFESDDIVYFMGDSEQIACVSIVFHGAS